MFHHYGNYDEATDMIEYKMKWLFSAAVTTLAVCRQDIAEQNN